MSDKSVPMTYARLEEVLTRLGFTKRTTDEFVAFLHDDPEALFVLPLTLAGDTISDWHLLSAQKVVSTAILVSPKVLHRMLSRRTLPDPTTQPEFRANTATDTDLITA